MLQLNCGSELINFFFFFLSPYLKGSVLENKMNIITFLIEMGTFEP